MCGGIGPPASLHAAESQSLRALRGRDAARAPMPSLTARRRVPAGDQGYSARRVSRPQSRLSPSGFEGVAAGARAMRSASASSARSDGPAASGGPLTGWRMLERVRSVPSDACGPRLPALRERKSACSGPAGPAPLWVKGGGAALWPVLLLIKGTARGRPVARCACLPKPYTLNPAPADGRRCRPVARCVCVGAREGRVRVSVRARLHQNAKLCARACVHMCGTTH
jgi:hypothetical protein